jgi:hypothetical protein
MRPTTKQSAVRPSSGGRPTYKPTVRPDIGFQPTSSVATTRPPDGPTTTSKYRPTIQPAIMATYGPTISFLSTKVTETLALLALWTIYVCGATFQSLKGQYHGIFYYFFKMQHYEHK